MTATDLILIAIIAVALITGWMRGFVQQIGTVAGIIFGIIVCRMWGGEAADYLVSAGTEHAGVARACVYAVIFIAVFLSCNLLARLASSILKAVKLKILDRAAGAVMRAFLWLLFTSLALNIYLGIYPEDRGRFENPQKPWRSLTVKFAPHLLGYLTT